MFTFHAIIKLSQTRPLKISLKWCFLQNSNAGEFELQFDLTPSFPEATES